MYGLGFRLSALYFVLLILAGTNSVNAQIFSNPRNSSKSISSEEKIISDTSKNRKQGEWDNSVEIFQLDKDDTLRYAPDTTVSLFHRNALDQLWVEDLGNTGTAFRSLKAVPPEARYTFLPLNNTLYKYDAPERFYNTTKPYTSVAYSLGTKQEQILEVIHTRNITPLWNITAQYRKINSPGFYKMQKANHDNAMLLNHYQSRNLQYIIDFSFIYNKLQNEENLGIVSFDLLSEPLYRNRRSVPVNIALFNGTSVKSPMSNYDRDFSMECMQTYFLGKRTIHESEGDSTQRFFSFKPRLGIRNRTYYRNEYYRLKHLGADSLYKMTYFRLVDTQQDSLLMEYRDRVLGTSFSLIGNLDIGRNIFSVEGGWGIENQKLHATISDEVGINNYIFGTLKNLKTHGGRWNLFIRLKSYFTGPVKGNTHFDGRLETNLSDHLGSLNVFAKQILARPYFAQENMETNGGSVHLVFKQTSYSRIGGGYANSKWHTELKISSSLIHRYIYFDDFSDSFRQYDRAIPILSFEWEKTFHWRKFVLNNHFLIQYSSRVHPYHLPLFSSRHAWYFTDNILKEKLNIATGLDFGYHSSYYNDGYNPVLMSFAPQYLSKGVSYPRVGYFFNFKIKKYRAFLMVDELQRLLISNSLKHYNYPSRELLVRFGFNWVFIN